jgi:hypothetical protein
MTQFEFLSVAASIVYALSLGRLVVAAPAVFVRATFDALFAAIYLSFFLMMLVVWWILWEASTVENWNFIGYLLFILTPLLYFLCAHVLVPNDGVSVGSWAQHYVEVGRLFCALLAITFILSVGRGFYIGTAEPSLGVAVVAGIPILTFVAGSVSTNRFVHWGVVVVIVAFSMIRASVMSLSFWQRMN